MIKYLTWTICTVCVFFCSCDSSTSGTTVDLFSLQNYLGHITESWKQQSNIEKTYQSGDSPREASSIPRSELPQILKLFEKYDINKPDYVDKYSKEELDNQTIYTATHRNPKVRKCVVYQSAGNTFPDSVYIDYQHHSVIGNSLHEVMVNDQKIQLRRTEKYLFSDSLRSVLTIRK